MCKMCDEAGAKAGADVIDPQTGRPNQLGTHIMNQFIKNVLGVARDFHKANGRWPDGLTVTIAVSAELEVSPITFVEMLGLMTRIGLIGHPKETNNLVQVTDLGDRVIDGQVLFLDLVAAAEAALPQGN